MIVMVSAYAMTILRCLHLPTRVSEHNAADEPCTELHCCSAAERGRKAADSHVRSHEITLTRAADDDGRVSVGRDNAFGVQEGKRTIPGLLLA